MPIITDPEELKQAEALFKMPSPEETTLPGGLPSDKDPIYTQPDKTVSPGERLRLESEAQTGVETTGWGVVKSLIGDIGFFGDTRKVAQKNALNNIIKGQAEGYAAPWGETFAGPDKTAIEVKPLGKATVDLSLNPTILEETIANSGLDLEAIKKGAEANLAFYKGRGQPMDYATALYDVASVAAEDEMAKRVHVSSRASRALPGEGKENKAGFGYSIIGGAAQNLPYMAQFMIGSALPGGVALPLLASFDRRFQENMESEYKLDPSTGGVKQTEAGMGFGDAIAPSAIGAVGETAMETVGGAAASKVLKVMGSGFLKATGGDKLIAKVPFIRSLVKSFDAIGKVTKVQEYPVEILEELGTGLWDAGFKTTKEYQGADELGERFAKATKQFGRDLPEIALSMLLIQTGQTAFAAPAAFSEMDKTRNAETDAAVKLRAIPGMTDEKVAALMKDQDAKAAFDFIASLTPEQASSALKRMSARSRQMAEELSKTAEWGDAALAVKDIQSRFARPASVAEFKAGDDGISRWTTPDSNIEIALDPNGEARIFNRDTNRQAFVNGGTIEERLDRAYSIADALDRESQGRDLVNGKKREMLSKLLQSKGVEGKYVIVDSEDALMGQEALSDKARRALADHKENGGIPQGFVDDYEKRDADGNLLRDADGNILKQPPTVYFVLDNIRMGKGQGSVGKTLRTIVDLATHEPFHRARYANAQTSKVFRDMYDQADRDLRLDVIKQGIELTDGKAAVPRVLRSLAATATDSTTDADYKDKQLRRYFEEGVAYGIEGTVTPQTTGFQKTMNRMRELFKREIGSAETLRVMAEQAMGAAKGKVTLEYGTPIVTGVNAEDQAQEAKQSGLEIVVPPKQETNAPVPGAQADNGAVAGETVAPPASPATEEAQMAQTPEPTAEPQAAPLPETAPSVSESVPPQAPEEAPQTQAAEPVSTMPPEAPEQAKAKQEAVATPTPATVSKPAKKETRPQAVKRIKEAFAAKNPVSVADIDKHGVKVPDTYGLKDGQYVYTPTEMVKATEAISQTQQPQQKEATDAQAIRSDEGQVRAGSQEGQPEVRPGASQGGGDFQFKKSQAPSGAQVKVDRKGRTPSQVARLRETAAKVREATADGQGMLPKKETPSKRKNPNEYGGGMYAELDDSERAFLGSAEGLNTDGLSFKWKPLTDGRAVLEISKDGKYIGRAVERQFPDNAKAGLIQDAEAKTVESFATLLKSSAKQPTISQPAPEPEAQQQRNLKPSSDVSGREGSPLPRIAKGAKVATTYDKDNVSYVGEFVKDNGDGTSTFLAVGARPRKGLFRRFGVDANGVQVVKRMTVPSDTVRMTEPLADVNRMTPAQREAFRLMQKVQDARMEKEIAAGASVSVDELTRRAMAEERRQAAKEGQEIGIMFSMVKDPDVLARLNSEPSMRVFRAMQVVDGKLYPPMSGKVKGKWRSHTPLGEWEQAEEQPELAKDGKFVLNKGNKSSIEAAYNPYFHTSRTPLNDQFLSAYKRPNLVTVEVEIPMSELTSGYRAKEAKDSVGEKSWHTGVVSSKLPKSKARKVILSRFARAVRIIPDSEVAESIARLLEGEGVAIPENTVTPSLAAELRKRGVPVVGKVGLRSKAIDARKEGDTRFSMAKQEQLSTTQGAENEDRQRAIAERYNLAAVSVPDSVQREMQGTNRAKLAEDLRGVHREFQKNLAADRGVAQVGTRFRMERVTPEQDAAYMDAVNRGDMAAAQGMVDEATSGKMWYNAKHGTPETARITVFGNKGGLTGARSAEKAFFFSNSQRLADTYRMQKRGEPNEDAIRDWVDGLSDEQVSRVMPRDFRLPIDSDFMRQYARDALKERMMEYTNEDSEDIFYGMDEIISAAKSSKVNVPEILDPQNVGKTVNVKLFIKNPLFFSYDDWDSEGMDGIIERALSNGHDGVVSTENIPDSFAGLDNKNPPSGIIYAVFSPNQIKSADPVTRDDAGNVIPLSERFNEKRDDIRFRMEQTGTPEFKAWFRDSKVVDAEGKPLVTFHAGMFDENENGIPEVGEQGMHFGTRMAAEARQSGKLVDDMIRSIETSQSEDPDGVMKWYWTMDGMDSYDMNENGFDTEREARNDAEETAVDTDFSDSDPMPTTQAYLSIRNPKTTKDMKDDWTSTIAKAKAEGYDGIIYRNEFEDKGSLSYIVFSPTQIKSATDNVGTFDPMNPDIRFRMEQEDAPVFFSQLRRTLEQKMPNRMTVQALRGMIDPSKSGVKAEEIEWTGLREFMESRKPGDMVTKEEVLAAIRDVKIEEVTKGQWTPESDEAAYNAIRETLARSDALTEEAQNTLDVWLNEPSEKNREVVRTVVEDAGYDFDLFFEGNVAENQGRDETKFSDYQLPGGENYRELLLTLPAKESPQYFLAYKNGSTIGSGYASEAEALNDMEAEFPGRTDLEVRQGSGDRSLTTKTPENFKSSHFDEPNILAHVRYNERLDSDGNKVLFLEEIQSDWHQEGREKGYNMGARNRKLFEAAKKFYFQIYKPNRLGQLPGKDANEAFTRLSEETGFTKDEIQEEGAKRGDFTNTYVEPGVPDAPFKDTSKGWARLAFKRMLRMAAENGFDKVAWTTGEQQAERYDLSKQISKVEAYNFANGEYSLFADDLNGKRVIEKKNVSEEELPGIVGKDLAEKIVASPYKRSEFSGLDLKVGGEGMKMFYDRIVPQIANDIGKKFGAKVEDMPIFTEEKLVPVDDTAISSKKEYRSQTVYATVHVLPVTSSMKESVMQGQTMFSMSQDEEAKLAKTRAIFGKVESLMDNDPTNFRRPAGAPQTPIVEPQVLDKKELTRIWGTLTGGELPTPHSVNRQAQIQDAEADYNESEIRDTVTAIANDKRDWHVDDDTLFKMRLFYTKRQAVIASYKIQMDAAVKNGDAARINALSDMTAGAEFDMTQAANALSKAGSKRGQALQALQTGMDKDYNVVYRIRQYRKTTGRDVSVEDYRRIAAAAEEDAAEQKKRYDELKQAITDEENKRMEGKLAKVRKEAKAKIEQAYRKGAEDERASFEFVLNEKDAKRSRRKDPTAGFDGIDIGGVAFRIEDGSKGGQSTYPGALRDLARKIFLAVQAEGGGSVVFTARMFKEGKAKGFSGEMIDNYVYDFLTRLGVADVTPTQKMPVKSTDASGKVRKFKNEAAKRDYEVKDAVKRAVAEDMTADGDKIAKRAIEILNEDGKDYADYTVDEVYGVITGYPVAPEPDTRDGLERRYAMIRRHMLAIQRKTGLENKEYPTKMTNGQDAPDVTLRQLAREVRDMMNNFTFPADTEDPRLVNAQKALENRLQYAIEELQKAVDTGTPTNEKAPRAVEETPEIKKLRAILRDLRESYEAMPSVEAIREVRDTEKARRAANKRYHFWFKRLEDAKTGVYPETFKGDTQAEKDAATKEYRDKAEAARLEYWEIKKNSPQERLATLTEKVTKAEERLASLEAALAETPVADPSQKKEPFVPANAEEAEAQARLDATREAIAGVRKAIQAKWRDENAEAIYKVKEAERFQYLSEKAAMIEKKIKDKDYTKAPKRQPVTSGRIVIAEEKVRQGNRTIEEKILWEANQAAGWTGIAKNWYNLSGNVYRAFKASFDSSNVGVQSARLFTAHPLIGGRLLKDSWNNAFTDEKMAEYMATMHEDPQYEMAYGDGLALDQQFDDMFGTGMGESFFRGVAERAKGAAPVTPRSILGLVAKGVVISQRAFDIYGRAIRFEAYKAIVNDPAHANLSAIERKAIANAINIMGGVGNTKMFNHNVASVMGDLMWSSRLFTAQLQSVTGGGGLFWNAGLGPEGSRANMKRKWYQTAAPGVAKLYARSMAGNIVLAQMFAAIGMMLGDRQPWEDEETLFWKAFNFLFGRPVIGSKTFDFSGGLTTYVTLARKLFIDGSHIAMTGRAVSDEGFSGKVKVLSNFFRGRLRPDLGFAINVAFGEDVTGEKFGPRAGAEGMLNMALEGGLPITPLSMIETVKDLAKTHGATGLAFGLIPSLAGDMFGMAKSSAPRDPRYEIERHKSRVGQVKRALKEAKETGDFTEFTRLQDLYLFDVQVEKSVGALDSGAKKAMKVADDKYGRYPAEVREQARKDAESMTATARDILLGNRK